jgi:4'-phosphopantetheinyl transferase
VARGGAAPAGCTELSNLMPGIRLWWVDLDEPLDASADDALSPSEQVRAAQFVFPTDARRYRAAHAALRYLLGEHCGWPDRREFVIAPQGKPRLAGSVHVFNLSHSGSAALIGIGRGEDIGVDVELLRGIDDVWSLAEQVLSPDERNELRGVPPQETARAFLMAWTRKEACLKAVGCGLSLAPRDFEVGLVAGLRRTTLDTDRGVIEVEVHSLDAGQGALAAVARVARTNGDRPAHRRTAPA